MADGTYSLGAQAPEMQVLFGATFTASEGQEEGALIGDLVGRIARSTAEDDLLVSAYREDGVLMGGMCFTRMSYSQDPRTVFLLSPAAVHPDVQGRGIGLGLIARAAEALADMGCSVLVTYGDPAFYGKSGFEQVSTELVPAPMPLNYPDGWLARSLDGPLTALKGQARCVPAFNDPALW